jgi:hypothetical protein
METSVAGAAGRWLTAATLAALLVACHSRPEIRTQAAPDFEVGRYQTYGFMERPSTDTAGYTTLTTRYLKDAVAREMQARGYTLSESPELLVNFRVDSKDKVEGRTGPTVGVGYGRWWHRGWGGWGGIGVGDRDIRTVTEGALSLDLVDRQSNTLVWSGTASGTVTKAARENPQAAIDQAVQQIFAKYPKPAAVAAVTK